MFFWGWRRYLSTEPFSVLWIYGFPGRLFNWNSYRWPAKFLSHQRDPTITEKTFPLWRNTFFFIPVSIFSYSLSLSNSNSDIFLFLRIYTSFCLKVLSSLGCSVSLDQEITENGVIIALTCLISASRCGHLLMHTCFPI